MERFTVEANEISLTSSLQTMSAAILESIYSCLVSSGLASTAKSLAKEAKLDEKKLKKNAPADLMQLYTQSLKYVKKLILNKLFKLMHDRSIFILQAANIRSC